MTEPEVLYNFGVLTKRYELVSRTVGQLAPGIAGLLVGFFMIVVGAPLPLPFAPVLVGFWFALGKIPFGRHRGARVRAVIGPLARYWYLRLAGRTHWAMPAMWLSVAVDPAATRTLERGQLDQAPPATELAGVEPNRRDRRPRTPSGRQRGGGRTRREAGEQVPPELGRLRWMALHFDGAEAGLLFERARRQNLLTAVISVSGGDRFVFSGPDEQAAQIFHWGEVLGAMASEGSGLRRLQWVERATPQPSTVQEDWARGAMREVSPSEWADYQSLQSAIGTAAIHHDVYLGAQVETDTGSQADVLAEAASELAQLCEHLHSIGLRPTVLSRRGIAVMRQWADPTALERLALWGDSSIPTSGAGPAARHVGYDTVHTDGYVHRVGQIAAWPRIDVATEWMYPLLSTALPGSVRTVSVHLEAVSTEQAFAEVRDARTTGGMAQRKRDEKGIITTEEEERRVDEARSRERELTRGFRQHKIAGLVMVSSPDAETAARAWRQAERKAVECHLDLRELHARGHEAWAATLPLCRLRFALGAALMLRLAPMAVTTRHSASAYPFQCQAGLPFVGPVIGQEVLGQGMFCYDPFCLYDNETLLSPCMLVSGNKGYGKSAFVKVYLHRQSMAGRWLAILDPKGEYLDLAERDGLSVLGLRPNGPVRLNPLDAGPAPSASGSDDVRGRRIGVVVALAESAVGRAVSSDERSVVTSALMELERRGGRATPTLRHVMDLLMGPTAAMAAELSTGIGELAADAKSVARGLHRLVEGDLAGMFDGASTTTVDWSGPGIAIDLSAVLQSPAFSAILVCAGAWLAQAVAAKDRQRIIVVDECWKAIRDAGFVAWAEETQKLSRAYGVQFVTIVQRISDLAAQADDGTTTSKRAQGFVTEAETKVTFNLGGGEARASRDVMDWTESEALLVPKLPRGRALWRVGEHGAIVQTILSRRDVAMCDSNQAMRSRP